MIQQQQQAGPYLSLQNASLMEDVRREQQIGDNISLTEEEYRLFTHVRRIEIFELVF